MQYGYHEKTRIGCVEMFHTTYGMGKYNITITSKSGTFEFKSSMSMSLESIKIMDPINTNSWDMLLL